MALKARLKRVNRLLQARWLRYLLLHGTDPRLDYIQDLLGRPYGLDVENPLPRYTWDATCFLRQFLPPAGCALVAEWGAGNSTLWYANLGCRVVAVEHDRVWANHIRRTGSVDIEVLLRSRREEYVTALDAYLGDAAVVAIDGRYRVDCALRLAQHITSGAVRPGCIIVFDDAQREQYACGVSALVRVCRDLRVFGKPVWVDVDHVTLVFHV